MGVSDGSPKAAAAVPGRGVIDAINQAIQQASTKHAVSMGLCARTECNGVHDGCIQLHLTTPRL